VCDRFDLQTDIWRGRILRAIRDREQHTGDGRGTGFLYGLNDREISKFQTYSWIELANSACVAHGISGPCAALSAAQMAKISRC
jgi:hypothetical protein